MAPLSRSFFAAATEVTAAEQIRQGGLRMFSQIFGWSQLQFNLNRVEDGIDNRCSAYKSLDGRLLKVTYAAEQDGVVVITVIEKERV